MACSLVVKVACIGLEILTELLGGIR